MRSKSTWGSWVRLGAIGVAAVLAVAAFLANWFYGKLKGSLPMVDGKARVAGLGAQVRVERDALGVPTIQGHSLEDVARALGYVHGQDRFFQMDLSRRRAAGELAELVGKAALGLDQSVRLHDFRRLAEEDYRLAPEGQRRVLAAYAAGVNAGLASLKVKPFEYVVLRTRPAAWKPEDCFLVSYAMTITLQDQHGEYLRALEDVRATFGERFVDFISPLVGPDDAAMDGTTAPLPPIPGPDVINLRVSQGAGAAATLSGFDNVASGAGSQEAATGMWGAGDGPSPLVVDPIPIGSNSFAVAGRDGEGAVVADDMHLDLGVPNIWYRASLVWPGHRVTGVTLPGAPAVIAGSNGHVAWGFTNSFTGTGDLIAVNSPNSLPDYYVGPGGNDLPIQTRKATIHVKGSSAVDVSYPWTIWGPIVGKESTGRLLVYHWAYDDPAACNYNLLSLADAGTLDQAIEVAHQSGIPNQNFVVADDTGHIAWTIAGRLPKRKGYAGRWPVFWQYGDRGWDGWLSSAETPTLRDQDLIWTANQRILGGAALEKLGDGGYYRGARAAQIRDDLRALRAEHRPVRPRDLLAVQLDDRAPFLAWWRDLALSLEQTDPNASAHQACYDALRHWGARASVDSAGYRLARDFRIEVARHVLGPIADRCRQTDPDFRLSRLNTEPALRAIVAYRPMNFLSLRFRSWNSLLLSALDVDAQARLKTWGEVNTLHIVHPFSHLLPSYLTGWLNMPAEQAPGDADMPRVQGPAYGASERFAVSPGHEADGIFEMPCGESGHPLSPFYRAGHEAWVHGEPTPFLPGPTAHLLILQP